MMPLRSILAAKKSARMRNIGSKNARTLLPNLIRIRYIFIAYKVRIVDTLIMRVAVVDKETCNPKKCGEICERMCPINRKGDPCIAIGEKASIVEDLCIGCGICINVCPVDAINIVNTPEQLKESPIHR